MYKNYIKRFLDIFFSFMLLIFLLPVFIVITIVLIFTNNGKPFYIQKRSGKNGESFYLIKFKTMKDIYDDKGEILHDSKRLTTFGKFLREYSLDELPQLINVLKGDMSLIGPRPLIEEYLPLYNQFQKRRLEVKPGITGWAQVNGRKEIPFSKRFELDVWYVDNISFRIDIKIFLLTIIKVLKRENSPAGKLNLDVDDVGFRDRLGIKRSKVS